MSSRIIKFKFTVGPGIGQGKNEGRNGQALYEIPPLARKAKYKTLANKSKANNSKSNNRCANDDVQ